MNNTVNIPKTKQEAVKLLKEGLDKDRLNYIKKLNKENLISLHFSLGMAIRNNFKLWEENSELLLSLGGGHPDDVSMEIINALWEDLNK